MVYGKMRIRMSCCISRRRGRLSGRRPRLNGISPSASASLSLPASHTSFKQQRKTSFTFSPDPNPKAVRRKCSSVYEVSGSAAPFRMMPSAPHNTPTSKRWKRHDTSNVPSSTIGVRLQMNTTRVRQSGYLRRIQRDQRLKRGFNLRMTCRIMSERKRVRPRQSP